MRKVPVHRCLQRVCSQGNAQGLRGPKRAPGGGGDFEPGIDLVSFARLLYQVLLRLGTLGE